MENDQKILVAIDGSDQSLDAVRYVGGMTSPARTTVVLFHVNTELPESFMDLRKEKAFRSQAIEISSWAIQIKKNISDFMDNARTLLIEAGFAGSNVKIKMNSKSVGIARDILRESHNNYSALVVGRSGVSKLKDILMGSVANKLIGKMGHIPIIVVGGSPALKKVSIGFDGSAGAMKAVKCVGDLVNKDNCMIKLCHVIRPIGIHLGIKTLFNPQEETKWIESNTKEIQPAFDDAINQLAASGFPKDRITKEIVTKESSRAMGIIRSAEREGYQTVAIGRRGLTAVEEFFIGRVSTKVLQMGNKMAVWIA